MARPAVTPTTEVAYAGLGPLTEPDELYDWPLLRFLDSLLRQLDDVEQLSRDSDTHVGWGKLLDLETVPDYALSWLAQFVGVSPIRGLDAESQRIRISQAAGWHRGSPSAIIGAARQYLTGTRQVFLSERDSSPYHFTVRTYLGETPDPAVVEAALQALKPAGLVMDYEVATGAPYSSLTTDFTTYSDLDAAFDDYSAQTLWIPGA